MTRATGDGMIAHVGERERMQKRLGAALKAGRERSGLTQAQAALALHELTDTVAKWDQGRHSPDLFKIPAIERAYRLPKGWILKRAGFLDDVSKWPLAEIIASDPTLPAQANDDAIAGFVARLLRRPAQMRRRPLGA